MMDRIIVRRNWRIPVDDDGYVPVKALIERQGMRRPHAQNNCKSAGRRC